MSKDTQRKRKILVIGPSESGKTCIVHRLKYGEFLERTSRTIGVSEEEVGEEIRIIEIGGQEKFEGLMDKLNLRQGAALIFYVIDINKEEDFKRYQQFVKEFSEEEKVTVLANKIDLLSLNPDDVPIHLQNLRHRIVLCSAKTGDNFMTMRETIMDVRRREPRRTETDEVAYTFSQAEKEEARKKAQAILKKFRRSK